MAENPRDVGRAIGAHILELKNRKPLAPVAPEVPLQSEAAPPVVNITTPEVVVNVPAGPAPTVNVETAAPVINVETLAPIVNVTAPAVNVETVAPQITVPVPSVEVAIDLTLIAQAVDRFSAAVRESDAKAQARHEAATEQTSLLLAMMREALGVMAAPKSLVMKDGKPIGVKIEKN